MKKHFSILPSLLCVVVFFLSCQKEGGGDVNLNNLEGTNWKAERTAVLLSGREVYSIPNVCVVGDYYYVNSVLFSNGNATVAMSDGTTGVFPYSIVDNSIYVSNGWGGSLQLTPNKLNRKEIVIQLGEVSNSIPLDENVFANEVLVDTKGGVDIYFICSAINQKYFFYYYNDKGERIKCYYWEDAYFDLFSRFYQNLSWETLTREELLLFMRGLYRHIYRHNNPEELLIKVRDLLGLTEDVGVFFLLRYDYCYSHLRGIDNVLQQISFDIEYNGVKTDFGDLTQALLSSFVKNDEQSNDIKRGSIYAETYKYYWEIVKLFIDKTKEGNHWTDGILIDYFKAQ